MEQVYPEFADRVSFYAVGIYPGAEIEFYEKFRLKKGYAWPVAVPQGDLLPDLGVTIQSTKIAFDGDGVIRHRAAMGQGSPEIWRKVFSDLAASN